MIVFERNRYVAPATPILDEEDKRKVAFIITKVGGVGGGGSGSSTRTIQSPFTVRNVSNCDIRVFPKSNLNVTFTLNTYPYLPFHLLLKLYLNAIRTLPAEPEPTKVQFAEHKRSPFKLCGKPFVLNSDQKGDYLTLFFIRDRF